ncbi:MAG TPA: hypothetical protein ENH91_13525 [Leeuwenhoekiella sp.]|nr:hypothetical protein [Leeuwenhoekiella sp.]
MKRIIMALCFGPLLAVTGCSLDDYNGKPPSSAQFTITIENVATAYPFIKSGVFNMPSGDTQAGAATPGKEFEFTIDAGRSEHLSFATMLAATNDLFYGPDDEGIALYDDEGNPISGDVTDQVYLWDAGTEVNEEPAVGPNTVTNQPAPDTGEDENENVRSINDVTTGFDFNYPAVNEIINVSIAHVDGTQFKVTIKDLATAMLATSEGDRPAPLSPGVWVVHAGLNPLYTIGEPDFGNGVEAIAEDGNASPLGEYASTHTGVTYPASPGGWVVHDHGTKPLFTEGSPDYGQGVEAIAEDGSEVILGTNLDNLSGEEESAVFNTPEGSTSPGAILPGSKYTFSIKAAANENLSFATMLAATNDVFFAPKDEGIALFDENGNPISGDITDQVYLWDAGTEVNEEPAIGPNTVTNQLAPDTGEEENGNVMLLSDVNDGFNYPTVAQTLKVTITAN